MRGGHINEDSTEKFAFATVYLPDRITKWVTKSPVPEGPAPLSTSAWASRGEPLDNPLGAVPIVPFINRPRLGGLDGRSEFGDLFTLCDATNKLLTDLMVSAEFSATPRRWATGIELPVDDDEPLAAFSDVAGRVRMSEDPETRLGQFPEADLAGYLGAIEMLTQQISSLTATPPHYLNVMKGQLTSAESIPAAEAALVAKARRRQRVFGGA